MRKTFIPVAQPVIAKNAKKYVLESLKSGWVSSKGLFVEKFENAFAHFIRSKYAIATSSGTSALHLALAVLNIGPEDEVIVPTLTMIATILPILYQRAKPVLIDSKKETGNMDVDQLEKKITQKTKAIMVVHLHGHPVDMDKVIKIARKYKLYVIEDAAEAHGAEYKGKKVGGIGDLGCFSFYGNKIITTGEGGMVMTNNKRIAERIKSLRNLARTGGKHFLHKEIGYAYRMSNLQAALGLAQIEEINRFIKRKREIANLYFRSLNRVQFLELFQEKPYVKSVFWQYGVLIKKNLIISRNQLEKILEKKGIETRRFFVPMHEQPALKKLGLFKNEEYPVAEDLSKRGFCLPSGLAIKNQEIRYISKILRLCMRSSQKS